MTAKIIDGKKIAAELIKDIKEKVQKLKRKPGLAVILVGDNPASQMYVGMKEKMCKELGFYFERHDLEGDTSDIELLKLIDTLNQKEEIDGILVQLPLPKHLDERLVIDAVLPYKDVDGFHPINMGNLLIGKNMIVPATPRGIMKLIESTKVNIEGKNAVVVGRSNIVGKPVAILLQQKNATVTMCHSKTKDLAEHTKRADILVVAIGKPKLITKDMVKKGAIVIDVGTNKVEGKVVGDVDFDNVKEVAGYVTPVPKGVGPMTIAMLLDNALKVREILK